MIYNSNCTEDSEKIGYSLAEKLRAFYYKKVKKLFIKKKGK